jgi:hypothetical protein
MKNYMRRALPLPDNAEPKPAAIDPTLDEDAIAALIELFKLLGKWDHEQARSSSPT